MLTSLLFFSYIVFCFTSWFGINKPRSLKPFSGHADTRSAFEILATPFVNWFRKLKESFALICKDSFALIRKDSLITSLLNLYKLYLSFLMACFFFIMYASVYTDIGFTVYRLLPILAFCMFSFIRDDLVANPEGDFSDLAYDVIILFRFFTFTLALITTSAGILYICAKIDATMLCKN